MLKRIATSIVTLLICCLTYQFSAFAQSGNNNNLSHLTIYNANIGEFLEERTIELQSGANTVEWRSLMPKANIRTIRVLAEDAEVALTMRFTKGGSLTIHDGIDCQEFRPGGGEAVRREFGIPLDAPVAGIVGHIQNWKGQHLVVEAIARARRHFPDLRCLIVGGVHRRGVEYAAQLRERITAPDLAGHVFLAGAREDVPACLDAMDIVLHASTVPEPFGRVLIEAMALARPVIAPREGGPLVIVVDGETGLLVPIGDVDKLAKAVLDLLDDKNTRVRLGSAAQESVARKFGVERMIDETERIYREELLEIAD